MRKIILCMLLLWFSAASCFATQEFSFRGATWGMSKAQVNDAETGARIADDSADAASEWVLAYAVKEPVFGIDNTEALYFFKSSGDNPKPLWHASELNGCRYVFPSYTKPGDGMFADFERVAAGLAAKHGAPKFTVVKRNAEIVFTCADTLNCDQYYNDTLDLFDEGLLGRAYWALEDCEIYLTLADDLSMNQGILLDVFFTP